MSTSKWMGLWAQQRQGFYAGQVIKKAEIPKYTRIVMRYNKFYEKDSNRPRFVYCFADSEGYESKCVPIEIEEEEDPKRVYTYEQVQRAVNLAYCDGRGSDAYYGDVLVEDYL